MSEPIRAREEPGLWETSWHEAGHAVVGMHFGRLVKEIAYKPDGWGWGYCNFVDRDCKNTKREYLIDLTIKVAGTVSELLVGVPSGKLDEACLISNDPNLDFRLADPETERFSDSRWATVLAELSCTPKELAGEQGHFERQLRKKIRSAERKAEAIIKENWNAVWAIARALRSAEERRITGAYVSEILTWAVAQPHKLQRPLPAGNGSRRQLGSVPGMRRISADGGQVGPLAAGVENEEEENQ